MRVEDLPRSEGIRALREMGRISAENGNAEITLDAINAEIDKARRENNV